jgi:hypothetical protein
MVLCVVRTPPFLVTELQKLNVYNHVYLHYLQILGLDLKVVIVSKIKFKYLKVIAIILFLFHAPQY